MAIEKLNFNEVPDLPIGKDWKAYLPVALDKINQLIEAVNRLEERQGLKVLNDQLQEGFRRIEVLKEEIEKLKAPQSEP